MNFTVNKYTEMLGWELCEETTFFLGGESLWGFWSYFRPRFLRSFSVPIRFLSRCLRMTHILQIPSSFNSNLISVFSWIHSSDLYSPLLPLVILMFVCLISIFFLSWVLGFFLVCLNSVRYICNYSCLLV